MIKNYWWAGASVVLLCVTIGYIINRLYFLSHAQRTTGTIIQILSSNGTCGGGRRRRSYPCTRFQAQIEFQTKELRQARFEVSAGSCRGHNQPASCASYKRSQTVPVVYDPNSPDHAYVDTLMGVWATPLGTFFLQIMSMLCSFFDPKRRTY